MDSAIRYHAKALRCLIDGLQQDSCKLGFFLSSAPGALSELTVAACALEQGRKLNNVKFDIGHTRLHELGFFGAQYFDGDNDFEWFDIKRWVGEVSDDWLYVASLNCVKYTRLQVILKFRGSQGARTAARRKRLKHQRVENSTRACMADLLQILDSEMGVDKLHYRFKQIITEDVCRLYIRRHPIGNIDDEDLMMKVERSVESLRFAALQAKYQDLVCVTVARCEFNRIDLWPCC